MSRKQTKENPHLKTEPFQRVRLEMGEFIFHYNTESSDLWTRGKSHDWNPPIGQRDYDMMSMKEVKRTRIPREVSCSERYSKVIDNNPNVFYKRSGDFTKYIDSTIRVAKVGPFNKKPVKTK
jgi:hypothetical protein